MDRRTFALAMSGATLAGAISPFARGADAPPFAPSYSAIDVHCHLFNAQDLPIPGFVMDCYLSDLPKPIGFAVGFVVWLVAHVMDAGAMSAADEARLIRNGEADLAILFEQPSLDDIVRARVRATAARFQSRTYGFAPEDAHMDARIQKALLQSGQRMPTERERADGLRRLASYSDPTVLSLPHSAVSPDAVAAGAVAKSSPDSLKGILRLAALVTQRRLALTQQLAGLPSSYASEVKVFAPALIDYSYWLDDFEVSSLSDQVAVMSEIAAIKGRAYAVHPWVSFCPWRQLAEPGQMEIVKDAVLNKGFVGVKLYPVMGFLPIGNATAPDRSAYPRKLRRRRGWAKGLDDALSDLYDWCIAEDVPILSHCSQSQTPSPTAGKRASPKAWDQVLNQPRWSNLRLDLAHMGGLWDLTNPNNNHWTEEVVPMLARHRNLYADLADYSAIMHRPGAADQGDDTTIMTAVDRFLDKDASGMARKKLMYGTDWVMLSINVDVGTYYSSMRDTAPRELGVSARDFVGAAAARFLGLSISGGATPKTRSRLEQFYAGKGLDRALLSHWDS